MNVRVDFHNEFPRQAKRYRKKYHSFESDFQSFYVTLKKILYKEQIWVME